MTLISALTSEWNVTMLCFTVFCWQEFVVIKGHREKAFHAFFKYADSRSHSPSFDVI